MSNNPQKPDASASQPNEDTPAETSPEVAESQVSEQNSEETALPSGSSALHTDSTESAKDKPNEVEGAEPETDETDSKANNEVKNTDSASDADSADPETDNNTSKAPKPAVGDGDSAPDIAHQQQPTGAGGIPQQAPQATPPGDVQLAGAPSSHNMPQQPNYSSYGVATPVQPTGKKLKNVVGIVALTLAVVGLILGLIPKIILLGWFLMFAGLVTGVVGLFQQNKEKITSVTAIVLSILGGIISGIVLAVIIFNNVTADRLQSDGFTSSASSPASETSDAVPSTGSGGTSVLDGVLKFGETAEFEDGLKFTISEPRTDYTPSDYAKSNDPDMQNYLVFTVTIENNTNAPYDPYAFINGNSGGKEIEEIYDSAKGLNGPARSKILPGEKVSFDMAIAVADPNSVTLDVSVDFDHEDIVYTNK